MGLKCPFELEMAKRMQTHLQGFFLVFGVYSTNLEERDTAAAVYTHLRGYGSCLCQRSLFFLWAVLFCSSVRLSSH